MSLFNEFLRAYEKGFLHSNYYLSLDDLRKNLQNGNLGLEKSGNNFIFYQKLPKLMWYFANEKLECKKDFFVKILSKNENFLDKEDEFLKQGGFEKFKHFKEMKRSNDFILNSNQNAVFPSVDDKLIKKIHAFLSRFFDPNFLLFYDEKALKEKFAKNEAFVLLKEGQIQGVLVFSLNLNSTMLDFIAVDEHLKDRYTALTLLNAFFKTKARFFKLFVEANNQKAIDFYLKNGFEFTQSKLLFYKKGHKMKEITELFAKIERSDITPEMSNLLSGGIIDSLDIMALVAEIEKTYKKPLSAEFIEAENFESFEAIKKMIQRAMK